MIAFLILFIVNLWVLYTTKEPERLVEVKEKYRILREHISANGPEKFHMLRRCIPITGVYGMKGTVGYNTNKGGDIAVCLDGAPNEIFHVLLHELAHCTVKEYDHTDTFWKNYIELRDMCVELNVYTKIPERTPFCGEHVQDK
jgi:hypothetical protein